MAISIPLSNTVPVDQTTHSAKFVTLSIPSGSTSATYTTTSSWNLHEFSVGITGNALLTVAAEIVITLTLNSEVIYSGHVYIPATAGNINKLLDTGGVNLGGNVFPAGGDLVITASSALTAGTIFCNAYFA